MLIILGGLPGSGKSTIAQALAARIGACYLRIDTLEQAIRSCLPDGCDVGPTGYVGLYRLAADNLRLGRTVIVDSVNATEITRRAFRQVATENDRRYIEIEIRCLDATTHRHRAETRPSTIEGLTPPTWAAIEARSFEPWSADLSLDTFRLSVEDSVAEIMALL